jgi:hypothetical protein
MRICTSHARRVSQRHYEHWTRRSEHVRAQRAPEPSRSLFSIPKSALYYNWGGTEARNMFAPHVGRSALASQPRRGPSEEEA